MDVLVFLLAIYRAVAGVLTVAVVSLLRRIGKSPDFVRVFIGCVVALYLLSILSTCIATFPRRS
ncbi:MAG TPA: hypothetical protein VGP76_20665 [Planctomycetaceae bacterium]|jgi:hypothetical protein|nr:hypothetical protein [Planctomycetaceae bacterium]